MNEQIVLDNAARDEAMTPPPFRPNNEPHEDQQPEPCASPTLAEQIAALALDESVSQRLAALTSGIESQAVTPDLLTTLARGITRDEDVQNADAAGYLRGRNENIEAVLHPQPQDEEQTVSAPVFPRYCRRSIWD
jgi:hypothetical protein